MKLHFAPAGGLTVLCAASATLVAGHAAAQAPARAGAQSAGVYREAGPETSVEGLGRLLFWDPILSGERDVACATCHHPDFAYGDGRDLSLGTGSVGLGPSRTNLSKGRIPTVKRNAPTVVNTAFNGFGARRGGRGRDRGGAALAANPAGAPMLWDSRVRGLEAQALEPIKAREEMRGDAFAEAAAVDAVVARLRANPEYVALFRQAFGPESSVDATHLGEAIAAFERRLVAMNSPFDRYRAGDGNALTAEQRRGLERFERVGCDRCHRGVMFSDFALHAEGVREHASLADPDAGAGRFRFRTPTLRNVALTAPYMHNGTLATLEEVLRFYDNGRSENPNVAGRGGRRGGREGAAELAGGFRRVEDMTAGEMQDIIAFLDSLTDLGFDRTIPTRVPSGLPPGGSIGTGQPRPAATPAAGNLSR